ncbi:MAG TPA: nitroreductase family protein [Bacillota bacterium]|nr:nitroreductase family protein [Bacillota bacterium]
MMKSVFETIQMRYSVRNYSSRVIEPEKMRQISEFINSNTKGPLGSEVRFRIVDGTAYNQEELKELGAYGLLKGPRVFIAGAVKQNQYAMEDYGYCMEKNILMATGIGIGTCWLGGTLNRSAFARKLEISENEMIPAVTPIGYAADKNTLIGQAVSLVVGAKKRKGVEELFFNGDFDHPLDLQECGDFAKVLEGVRWAPSAGNRQPWRIMKQEHAFHFYLKEITAYNNNPRYLGAKLQNIDMGIAMAHFDLVAAELGLTGTWKIAEPIFNKKDLNYIVSWMEKAI